MISRAMMVLCGLFLASPALAADRPLGKVRAAFYNNKLVKAGFQLAIKPQCREFATPVAQGSGAHRTYGIGDVTVKAMAVSPLLDAYQGTASVIIGVGTGIRGTGPITSEVLFSGPKPTLVNLVKSVGVGLRLVKPAAVPVKVEADRTLTTMPLATTF